MDDVGVPDRRHGVPGDLVWTRTYKDWFRLYGSVKGGKMISIS